MKQRGIISFALAFMGLSGLFFQTSCKPDANLTASRVLAQEAASIMKKLEKKKSFLYESVIGKAIPLPEAKSKNPDITVTAELDRSNNTWASWDNNTHDFTLAQRPDGTAGNEEVKHTVHLSFTHKKAQNPVKKCFEITVPSAQKLVDHVAGKLENPQTETSNLVCQEDEETEVKENLKLPSLEDVVTNPELKSVILLAWSLDTQSSEAEINSEKTLLVVKPPVTGTVANNVLPRRLTLTVSLNEGVSSLTAPTKVKNWDLKIPAVDHPELAANTADVNASKLLFGFKGARKDLTGGENIEVYKNSDFQNGKEFGYIAPGNDVDLEWALARVEQNDTFTDLTVPDLKQLVKGNLDAGTYRVTATLSKGTKSTAVYCERKIVFTITLHDSDRPVAPAPGGADVDGGAADQDSNHPADGNGGDDGDDGGEWSLFGSDAAW